jgi:hypothetical protein
MFGAVVVLIGSTIGTYAAAQAAARDNERRMDTIEANQNEGKLWRAKTDSVVRDIRDTQAQMVYLACLHTPNQPYFCVKAQLDVRRQEVLHE